jgi:hypothetical protein
MATTKTDALADAVDNLSDKLANALTDYSDAALAANEGEPVTLHGAIVRAGLDVRAGLERLASAIESRGGNPS